MGKQIRAFNLDHEVGAEIDAEAGLLGNNKASALVNDLLREALARRRSERYAKKVTLQLSEATSALLVLVLTFWSILFFIPVYA